MKNDMKFKIGDIVMFKVDSLTLGLSPGDVGVITRTHANHDSMSVHFFKWKEYNERTWLRIGAETHVAGGKESFYIGAYDLELKRGCMFGKEVVYD